MEGQAVSRSSDGRDSLWRIGTEREDSRPGQGDCTSGKSPTSLSRQRVGADAQVAQGEDHVATVQRRIAGDRGGVKGQRRGDGVVHLRGSESHRAKAQRIHRLGVRATAGRPVENQTAIPVGQVAAEISRGRIE